jgi:phosphinothricin acetyltransferase
MTKKSSIVSADDQTQWQEVADIFNYYILNSMAAFSDQVVGADHYKNHWSNHRNYPFYLIQENNITIGFGFLSPLHLAPTMEHSVTCTYFIHPASVERGLGKSLLELLVADGSASRAEQFFVSISSKNTISLSFHERHGFERCGRLKSVGIKNGHTFDLIWMQRSVKHEC